MVIKVKIARFNPKKDKKPFYKTYEVLLEPWGLSILNVLEYIYENMDGSLSYYASCRKGLCKGCWVKVNGKPTLACVTYVRGDMTIEPIPGYEIVKDLYVDLEMKKTQ